MNELEATRAKLKCLEMVEGTGLKWWDVIKGVNGRRFSSAATFSLPESNYEFALGVVEGKPVWKGDTLYLPEGLPFRVTEESTLKLNKFTWNQPEPKTIMVELPIEIVKRWSVRPAINESTCNNISDACAKALKEAKCK